MYRKRAKKGNNSGVVLTFLRNGESTLRYLDMMYRHRR